MIKCNLHELRNYNNLYEEDGKYIFEDENEKLELSKMPDAIYWDAWGIKGYVADIDGELIELSELIKE